MRYTIETIAIAHFPYKRKSGIARQPGLVPATEICIKLNSKFTADSVHGLESFEYMWISFIFHSVIGKGWLPLVRPSRLDGRQKMGVFVMRSPHRPNYMGLSLLRLERIETGRPVRIYCSGADLLDGTPVTGIKPYIPLTEFKSDARSGPATEKPEQLNIEWAENRGKESSDKECEIISQSIAQDPYPAHQNIPERIYVTNILDYEVKPQIRNKAAPIVSTDTYQKP